MGRKIKFLTEMERFWLNFAGWIAVIGIVSGIGTVMSWFGQLSLPWQIIAGIGFIATTIFAIDYFVGRFKKRQTP